MTHEFLESYFSKLGRRAYQYLDELPISRVPEPLDSIMTRLGPALLSVRFTAIQDFEALGKPTHKTVAENRKGVGLNTIGMLADRLTILLIREWSIRNKGATNNLKAEAIYQDQTLDIIQAMVSTSPGSSALNSKITRITSDAKANCWTEAFWGLFATNLLLWESQEILYIKDISLLPTEELRSYIKWFAAGNIERNQYIQLCEYHYWAT